MFPKCWLWSTFLPIHCCLFLGLAIFYIITPEVVSLACLSSIPILYIPYPYYIFKCLRNIFTRVTHSYFIFSMFKIDILKCFDLHSLWNVHCPPTYTGCEPKLLSTSFTLHSIFYNHELFSSLTAKCLFS